MRGLNRECPECGADVPLFDSRRTGDELVFLLLGICFGIVLMCLFLLGLVWRADWAARSAGCQHVEKPR